MANDSIASLKKNVNHIDFQKQSLSDGHSRLLYPVRRALT
jgi:hypothetical protein